MTPWAFLVRNPGKSTPLILVIMLAVLLIAGIVAIMNSIPLSIQTVYGYSRFFTGATPRGDMGYFPELKRHFNDSPIPIERQITCRTVIFNIRSIVGPWPFVLYGMQQQDMEYVAGKMELGPLEGRLPLPGAPEVVVTEPLLRNLDLKLGDSLLKPTEEKMYSPNPVKIVGVFHSKEWLAVTSYDYLAENHFPPVDVLMLFAPNQVNQRQLDEWAESSLIGMRALTFTFPTLERDTQETFSVLFKILNLVVGLLVLVITIMMGMLISIHLSQRTAEFGLLQAVGFTRRQLVRRAFGEAVIVVLAGWIFGMLLVFGLLSVVKMVMMDPRALSLNPLDSMAYLYTATIPAVIIIAAAVTVWYRFRNFDPISVVERRIA